MKNSKIISLTIITITLITILVYVLSVSFKPQLNDNNQQSGINNNSNNSTTNSENNTTNTNPCPYLSNEDASNFLGVDDVELTLNDNSCTFVESDKKSFDMIVIGVSQISESEKSVYLSEIGKSIDPNITKVTVQDYDIAYWLPNYYQLHSIKGNKLVIVSVANSITQNDEALKLFTKISEKIFNNL